MSVDLTELFENASAPPMFVDADRVLARGDGGGCAAASAGPWRRCPRW
jgi:hypothetical protein